MSSLAERVREWGDELNRQWLEKGIERGRREGIEQGRAEGKREVVYRLTAQRFSPGTVEQLVPVLEKTAEEFIKTCRETHD